MFRTLTARGGIDADRARALFALLQTAPVLIVDADDALERRALDLLRHPAHDCLYLALAERTGRVMITADRRFVRRAAAAGQSGRIVDLATAPL